MTQNFTRIVSFVPSWTETLLVAEQNIIGRTRFCIHPAGRVDKIAVIGGTKSLNSDFFLKNSIDLAIVDKEENTKEMAELLSNHGVEICVSHVTSILSAVEFLQLLSEKLKNQNLQRMSQRYLSILKNKEQLDIQKFIKEVQIDTLLNTGSLPNYIEYVIWKNPWMSVGRQTFIADILRLFGLDVLSDQKYPVKNEDDLLKSFCFFSSEPFPFQKQTEHLNQLGMKGLIVDGEKISWYGIRNLLCLEKCLK